MRQTGRVQAKNPNGGGGWKRDEGWMAAVSEDKPTANPAAVWGEPEGEQTWGRVLQGVVT